MLRIVVEFNLSIYSQFKSPLTSSSTSKTLDIMKCQQPRTLAGFGKKYIDQELILSAEASILCTALGGDYNDT